MIDKKDLILAGDIVVKFKKGVVEVYKDVKIRKWTYSDGGIESSSGSKELGEILSGKPVLALAYVGDNDCEIDVSCGFQRWHGFKIVREVIKALRKIGIVNNHIKEIMKYAKVNISEVGVCWY